MATRKKKRAAPTPKGRGGQSGGSNPRNDGRITEEQHDDENRKGESGNDEKDCPIVVNHSVRLMKIPPLLIEKSPPLPVEGIEEIPKQGCGQNGNTTSKVKNRRDYVPP